jgi:uncharacterized protein (DUF1697 family)
MTFVALLRGINVGGNTLVPMRQLKELFERLGFASVKTYINSGNVVFDARETSARTLEESIEKALAKKFGSPIRVVVKSLPEMKRIVAAMPEEWSDTKRWRSNVIFLGHTIDKPSIMKELRFDPAIESVTYRKGALFWAVGWKDVTKSRVARLNRSPIYKEMTVRNPNTTRKIYELMAERSR